MILNAECTQGGNPQDDCLLARVDGDSAKLWTTFRPGQLDMSSSTYYALIEGLRRLPNGLNSGTHHIAGFTVIFDMLFPREKQDVPSTHVGDNLTHGVIIFDGKLSLFANTAEWDKFREDFVDTDGTSV